MLGEGLDRSGLSLKRLSFVGKRQACRRALIDSKIEEFVARGCDFSTVDHSAIGSTGTDHPT